MNCLSAEFSAVVSVDAVCDCVPRTVETEQANVTNHQNICCSGGGR